MNLTPADITIAITVYDRREFLQQAIESALNQTVPVGVMVVEDCGPDAGLEAWVRARFGARVRYHRNPRRRGLFDNWNACLELCPTPWLSILHDDDYLDPRFIEAMRALMARFPGCGLYFGETVLVDESGMVRPPRIAPRGLREARRVLLAEVLYGTPFLFPGQLIQVTSARALGGFRATSQFCGDWEMWAKLIARQGGAQSDGVVAFNRQHGGGERGTNKVLANGRLHPLTVVQHKRVLQMLRQAGNAVAFDRRDFQRRSPMSTRYLLSHGHGLSPRLLDYHIRLLGLSRAPHWRYRLFQWLVRGLGAGFVRWLSRLRYTWRQRPSFWRT